MMNAQICRWVVSFAKWAFAWAGCLSYWVACIGGGGSYVLYIATKNKKYVQFTIAAIVVYALIAASLFVTRAGA